jgi:hypothetical protein
MMVSFLSVHSLKTTLFKENGRNKIWSRLEMRTSCDGRQKMHASVTMQKLYLQLCQRSLSKNKVRLSRYTPWRRMGGGGIAPTHT